MPRPFTGPVRMPRPDDHRGRGGQRRQRHDKSDLKVAQATQTLDDLRQPERDAVEAGDETEIDEREEEDAAVAQRLAEPILAPVLEMRALVRQGRLEPL